MFQSAFMRLYVVSLSVVIVTAMRQNCGGRFPPCPAGQVCLPPGKQGLNGVNGQWKCYESSAPTDCGPLPEHVVAANYYGDNSIGVSYTYTCTPCTWYVNIGVASSTITCQADGNWSSTCVSAAQTGYLFDGTPLPVAALGCNSTCPNDGVHNGFTMGGVIAQCFCDNECCDNGDCCYNYSCIY